MHSCGEHEEKSETVEASGEEKCETGTVPRSLGVGASDASKKREPAILLLGGSFNPVHRSHVQMMARVKEHIDSLGRFRVVKGYLVLTTDGYVKGKLKNWAIKFEHRKALCKLAIAEAGHSHWLSASHIQKGSAVSYGEFALREFHSKKKKEAFASHMLDCCGADKLSVKRGKWSWRRLRHSPQRTKVAVTRKGISDSVKRLYEMDVSAGFVDSEHFVFADIEVSATSSTEIRRHMAKLMRVDSGTSHKAKARLFREKTTEMMHSNCIDYIVQHSADLWILSKPKSAAALTLKKSSGE